MQFFSSLFPIQRRHPRPPMDIHILGPRVMLRIGDVNDWKQWKTLREISRSFLTPWEPTWPLNAMHYSFFCSQLRRFWREWREGTAYNFLIFQRGKDGLDEGALVGGIALNEIQRGIAQKGTLGYWMGQPFAGQGYMTEAAELVCAFAFKTLKLHRVEATCLPTNAPSKKLLEKIGFDQEGYAKAYLQINGRWEDHILWGKTAGD